MAEMIEMQDFAEDKEQIPEENIDEAASDNFFRSLIFQRSARKKSAAPPAISCCRTAISGLTVFR